MNPLFTVLEQKINAFHAEFHLPQEACFDTAPGPHLFRAGEGRVVYFLQNIADHAAQIRMAAEDVVYTACFYANQQAFPEHAAIADAIRRIHAANARKVRMQFHFRSGSMQAFHRRSSNTVVYFLDNLLKSARSRQMPPADYGVLICAHELGHAFTPNGPRYNAEIIQLKQGPFPKSPATQLEISKVHLLDEIDAAFYGEPFCPDPLRDAFRALNYANIHRFKSWVDQWQQKTDESKKARSHG